MNLVVRIWRGLRLALVLAVAMSTLAVPPALAQVDNSFVTMHTLKIEGRFMCMADHYHVGASSGQATKEVARREAIYNWAGFTSLEYGDHWATFLASKSRTLKCKKSKGGWGCVFRARPCRKLTKSDRRQRTGKKRKRGKRN